MPRLEPPPGYVSAQKASEMLGVAQGVLARYVKEGRLKRYGPSERTHKFYKISEIEAVLAVRNVFPEYEPGQWRKNPTSVFSLAQDEDIEETVRISNDVFVDPEHPDPSTPTEIRLSWFHKNPETFFVLRNHLGAIVGFTSMLPLDKEIIDGILHGEVKISSLTVNDIELFRPGKPLHLYWAAICVDPKVQSTVLRREYGARLVGGSIGIILDFAYRGIEIETISARSRKPEGIRLLRKLGIPQIRSHIPGMNIYQVRIADSGLAILVRYSELLDQWKREHP